MNVIRGRYIPTFERDCPSFLFIIMVKHRGNCLFFLNLNGNPGSQATIFILGIRIFYSIFIPVIIVADIIFVSKSLTFSFVPLYKPFA